MRNAPRIGTCSKQVSRDMLQVLFFPCEIKEAVLDGLLLFFVSIHLQ